MAYLSILRGDKTNEWKEICGREHRSYGVRVEIWDAMRPLGTQNAGRTKSDLSEDILYTRIVPRFTHWKNGKSLDMVMEKCAKLMSR